MDNQNDPNSINPPTSVPTPTAPPFGAPPSSPPYQPPASPPISPPPTWPSIPTEPQPIPAPLPQPAPIQTPEPNLSPLDNPWGTPPQPPSVGELPQNPSTTPTPNQPTWVPPLTDPFPTPQPVSDMPLADPEPAIQSESAPTDLSHLISNNTPQENLSAQVTPETLIVPSGASTPPEVSVPTEPKKGIPKWVIGVGIGLLLIVATASAYFILGIGQGPKTPTSLPATTVPKTTTEVRPPAPIATPAAQESAPAAASGSANFGQLQGSGPQATSAAELLRQRQQQGR